MKPVKVSAQSAEKYYYEKDPIFNEDKQGNNIEFQGVGAHALGLEGTASKEEFKNILQGKDKEGNLLIEEGSNNRKIAAIDIPFGAPKSVSHAALVLGDEKVVAAHDKAVARAIDYIEKNYAKTRNYVKDESGSIARDDNDKKIRVTTQTENLIVAKVKHSTSRPVDGQAPDPHLHTHALIMNMTYDKETGKFKALSNEDIFQNQKLIGEIYKSELAKELQSAGYSIEMNSKGGFEIVGYDKETLTNFSKRHDEVEQTRQEMKEQGKEGGKIDEMAQHTSKSKKVEITKDELKNAWNSQQEKIIPLPELEQKIREMSESKTEWVFDAKQTLEIAASNLTKQEAVFSNEALLKEALKISRGTFGIDEIQKEFNNITQKGVDAQNVIRIDDFHLTTVGMKAIEDRNIEIIKNQKEFNSLLTGEQAKEGLEAFKNEKGFSFTESQYQTVFSVLTSTSQFIALEGDAGTGKTTQLEAIRWILEYFQKNTDLFIATPTGKAAAEAYEASGIDASTLHKFMNNVEKGVHGQAPRETSGEELAAQLKAAQGSNSGSIKISTFETQATKMTDAQQTKADKMMEKQQDSIKRDMFYDRTKSTSSSLNGMGKYYEINKDFGKFSKNDVSKYVSTFDGYKVTKTEKIVKGENAGSVRKSTFHAKGDDFYKNSTTTYKDGTRMTSSSHEWNPLKAAGFKAAGQMISYTSEHNVQALASGQKIETHRKSLSLGIVGLDTMKQTSNNGDLAVGRTISFMGLSVQKMDSHKTTANAIIDTKEKGFSGFGYQSKTTETNVLTSKARIESKEKESSFLGHKSSEKDTLTRTEKVDIKEKAKEASFLGYSVKSSVSQMYSKEGDLISTTATKETKFLGMTFGTQYKMENGVITQTNYSKMPLMAPKVEESKVVAQYEGKVSVDKNNQIEFDMKMTNDVKIESSKGNEIEFQGKKISEEEALKTLLEGTKIQASDKILIVDEASMVSARKGNEILEFAEKNNYRIIFQGDRKQIQSIEAGKFFDQVIGNTENLRVEGSVRQKNSVVQKDIVDTIASKDIVSGLQKIQAIDGVKEIKDFKERVDTAAALLLKNEKDTIVVAGTRAEVSAVNESVRALKFGDSKFGEEFTVKAGVNLNGFQSRVADSFEKGNFVQIGNNPAEFKIIDKDNIKQTLTLQDEKGKVSTFDLTRNHEDLTLTKEEKRNFAVGDKVVFLKNDDKQNIFNGQTGVITAIEGSKITIDKGEKHSDLRTIDTSSYKNLDHGYAITVNKSQGMSVKDVVAMFDSKMSGMNTFNFAYVALSRQKENLTVLTDDFKKVMSDVQNFQFKSSTRDFPEHHNDEKYLQGNRKQGFEVKESTVDIRKDLEEFKDVMRQGKEVSSFDVNNAVKDMQIARDSSPLDSKDFKDAQRGFMDAQLVLRNGLNQEAVRDYADHAVLNGRMTDDAADMFIKNTMTNAENLEKVGILKNEGNGNYSFVDSKAKEILFENLGADYKKIGEENLKAFENAAGLSEIKEAARDYVKNETEISKAERHGDFNKASELKEANEKLSEKFDKKEFFEKVDSVKSENRSLEEKKDFSQVKEFRRTGEVENVKEKAVGLKEMKENAKPGTREMKEAQRGLQDVSVIQGNGFRLSETRKFAEESVQKGSMTEKQADNFVNKKLEHAERLKETGLLKDDGKGNYSFVDSKAKEILSKNIGADFKELENKNVEAYKEHLSEKGVKIEGFEKIDIKDAAKEFLKNEKEISSLEKSGDVVKASELKEVNEKLSSSFDTKSFEKELVKVDREEKVEKFVDNKKEISSLESQGKDSSSLKEENQKIQEQFKDRKFDKDVEKVEARKDAESFVKNEKEILKLESQGKDASSLKEENQKLSSSHDSKSFEREIGKVKEDLSKDLRKDAHKLVELEKDLKKDFSKEFKDEVRAVKTAEKAKEYVANEREAFALEQKGFTDKASDLREDNKELKQGTNWKEFNQAVQAEKEGTVKEFDSKAVKFVENEKRMVNSEKFGGSVDSIKQENKSLEKEFVAEKREDIKKEISSIKEKHDDKQLSEAVQKEKGVETKEVSSDFDKFKDVKRDGFVDEKQLDKNLEKFTDNRNKAEKGSEEFREAQRGFMDAQAVKRDGISQSSLNSFAENSVEKGRMSQKDAEAFVKNSTENGRKLEEAGLMKNDGKDNFSFVDAKAKEILSENLGADYSKLKSENLKAYGSESSDMSEKMKGAFDGFEKKESGKEVSFDVKEAARDYVAKDKEFGDLVKSGKFEEAHDLRAEMKDIEKRFDRKEFNQAVKEVKDEMKPESKTESSEKVKDTVNRVEREQGASR